MSRFASPTYAYRTPPEFRDGPRRTYPVVVVGAGPVGLTIAIDLAKRGVPVTLLDADDTVSDGSRAICWSKRTLEIWQRLGVAAPMMAKGITWNRGRVFHRDGPLYDFDLQPEGGQQFPAFINLQQYYVEAYLSIAALDTPGIDLRWRNTVTRVVPGADGVRVAVATPEGRYELDCDWLIAADGVRSTVRRNLGLDFMGQVFEDRFLIADVRMKADFPTERWFWFDPPFHSGKSTLLHRQADDVWRIDFQLGWDSDPEAERKPERVLPRLRAMLGPDAQFELEWTSVYTFQCRRLEKFRHGRVVFAGDSAHVVSPFGARGGNGGVQDADNLAWKLAAVIRDGAPDALIDSYDDERIHAADENIGNSTRSTDFITPKTPASQAFRDAVLALARTRPFARALVNSGRLSVPAVEEPSPLHTPDPPGAFVAAMRPGSPAANAPLGDGNNPVWLLDRLDGAQFAALFFVGDDNDRMRAFSALAAVPHTTSVMVGKNGVAGALRDVEGLAFQRYDARPGTVYLLRPDQHVAARWRKPDGAALQAAIDRASGKAG